MILIFWREGDHLEISPVHLLLAGLNEDQQRAVTAPEQPTVVFAGPGSGKTTVLTRRVLYLLNRGTPAHQLMVVTFTRAAAKEMKERLAQILPDKVHKLAIGTFHSLFLMMLRDAGEQVYPLLSGVQQTRWMRQFLEERGQPVDDETVSTFLNQISLCKGNIILPDRMKVQKEKNILFRDLYMAYEEKKRAAGLWDYDDILLAFYHKCQHSRTLSEWQERFQHLLVDEFQDINFIQYHILLKLTQRHRRLFAVGDDDQSIYGFRGSDPSFMLQLKQDFPELRQIVLSVNYRSTDEIIRLADQLIQHNRMRQSKPRAGTGTRGLPVQWMDPENEEQEAEQILARLRDGMETAVLYRTSTQARALIDALVRKDIPFSVSTGDLSFYRRWQVQDILAYIQLAFNPNDLDALIRIINKPKRYLFGEGWVEAGWALARKSGRTVLEVLPELPCLETYQIHYLNELREMVPTIRRFSAVRAVRYICEMIGYSRYLEKYAEETGNDRDLVSEPVDELLLAAEHCSDGQALLMHAEKVNQMVKNNEQSPQVKLMTLHKAKGLEFDRVFLIGLHAMVLPHRRSLQVPESRKRAAWEEERRLLYVGITRAKSELYLSISKERQGKRVGISPFAREIGYGGAVDSFCQQIQSVNEISELRKSTPKKTLTSQPQMRFAKEEVSPGMHLIHNRFGKGAVIRITSIEGVAPGRKVLVRFHDHTLTLHYELSRQLGLISKE
ncbi:ATP-dependent helicase [Paenactinomyces guangxiensis]|uniref:DNA 3'-5' helicase n=1 Tax=Paenactinomyces guangxiensis TaxID=1490290 RepID=A0A7W1WT77_9BACL|nr:ATP-dependent helicase [Paenactinomyces guangxiensis]MBA4495638.1 ATP-dependent helicase [Paenactinomyces guangxiensis]MBH8592626.1 ATP-dependent helicase [Paenactinomyces guangxiensis]